jgi:hypothetical protein
MTIRALLGVKIFRRNAKHIVTLDAHAMEHWLPRCRSFMLRGLSLRFSRFGSHEQILAQNVHLNTFATACDRAGGIQARHQGILRAAAGAGKSPPLARLLPETLLECDILTLPVEIVRAGRGLYLFTLCSKGEPARKGTK